MSNSSPASTPASDQLGATLELFHREKAAMGDQRKELALLIKQAVAEIDRLTQRNREVSSQVRQLEANIESFSRAEIKQLYSVHQEAQMRLFMMQNQLEQLRHRQANLERTEQLLDGFLEMADSLLQLNQSGGVEAERPPRPATPTPGAAATAVLDSIETARLRLSRQLQDGPAQALSDLILRAEVCERLVAMDWQKGKEEMARLRLAISSALKSVRQLVHELQPPALEELGLGAALQRYVDATRLSERFRIDLQITGQERRLAESAELAVFRIVQEALANAAQHSGARAAAVALRFEPGQLLVTVVDGGRGFDVATVLAEAGRKERSGLSDMKTRAALIGGTLEVDSAPGSGCTIRLALPL